MVDAWIWIVLLGNFAATLVICAWFSLTARAAQRLDELERRDLAERRQLAPARLRATRSDREPWA